MKKNKSTILFIYNANSGIHNAILHSMHKVLSPATYDCNLCDITFGIVSENKTWKKFREASQHEMEFLHKDEFANAYASKYGHKFTFPIVLVEGNQDLEVLISTEELNTLQNAEALIELIKKRT